MAAVVRFQVVGTPSLNSLSASRSCWVRYICMTKCQHGRDQRLGHQLWLSSCRATTLVAGDHQFGIELICPLPRMLPSAHSSESLATSPLSRPADRMPTVGAHCLPDLPVDACGVIARAAVHLEGDDVQAWARFSLVNSVWRAALQDVPLRVSFAAPMTAAQQQWLSRTPLPLRSIEFHPMDPASPIVSHKNVGPDDALRTQGVLESSVLTLTKLRNMHPPLDVLPEADERPSLARYIALRDLTLGGICGPLWGVLARLPAGLRKLTLWADEVSYFGSPAHTMGGKDNMSLSYLVALEELTVVGDKCMRAANSYLYQQQARPGPLLPASLQVLLLGSSSEAWLEPFRWHLHYEAAASGVIPTLELQAHSLVLNVAMSSSSAETGFAGMSSLPTGFASLWMRAERIQLDAADTLGNRPCVVTAEEDLCRYFLAAPQSYSDFRIYSPDGGLAMAAPKLEIHSRHDKQLNSAASFGSLRALAEAMRCTPEGQALNISLLRDQQCLRILRPQNYAGVIF